MYYIYIYIHVGLPRGNLEHWTLVPFSGYISYSRSSAMSLSVAVLATLCVNPGVQSHLQQKKVRLILCYLVVHCHK